MARVRNGYAEVATLAAWNQAKQAAATACGSCRPPTAASSAGGEQARLGEAVQRRRDLRDQPHPLPVEGRLGSGRRRGCAGRTARWPPARRGPGRRRRSPGSARRSGGARRARTPAATRAAGSRGHGGRAGWTARHSSAGTGAGRAGATAHCRPAHPGGSAGRAPPARAGFDERNLSHRPVSVVVRDRTRRRPARGPRPAAADLSRAAGDLRGARLGGHPLADPQADLRPRAHRRPRSPAGARPGRRSSTSPPAC